MIWRGLASMVLATSVGLAVVLLANPARPTEVAGFFMHLVTEQRVIIWLLVLSAAFLVFLVFLPLWTESGIAPLWPLRG